MFSFLTAFTYTHRMYHNQLCDRLSPYGFSATQWALLRYLAENGPAMLSEVATYWQMERPSVTPIAQKLFNRELIFVAPSKDKRQKVMHISEKGLELYTTIKREMDAFQNDILEGVSDEERQITEHVLERMLLNIMMRSQ